MSHPDPLFDPENAYEDDDMTIEDENYDDYHDFHGSIEDWPGECEDEEEDWNDSYDDSMDGDFDSTMRDCGFGTDEDYGYYGDDTPLGEEYYGGE